MSHFPHLLLLLLLEEEEDEEELLELLLPLSSSPCAASVSATAASSGRRLRSAVSSLADILGRPFFVCRHACGPRHGLIPSGLTRGCSLCVFTLFSRKRNSNHNIVQA